MTSKATKIVWANALLSDGEILFWYTGSKCEHFSDFYKDFYFSGLNMTEYSKNHKLEVRSIGFVDETEDEEYNLLCFDVLPKDFYRQFKISPDSKGKKPYEC